MQRPGSMMEPAVVFMLGHPKGKPSTRSGRCQDKNTHTHTQELGEESISCFTALK